jgi:hypothetical protein
MGPSPVHFGRLILDRRDMEANRNKIHPDHLRRMDWALHEIKRGFLDSKTSIQNQEVQPTAEIFGSASPQFYVQSVDALERLGFDVAVTASMSPTTFIGDKNGGSIQMELREQSTGRLAPHTRPSFVLYEYTMKNHCFEVLSQMVFNALWSISQRKNG